MGYYRNTWSKDITAGSTIIEEKLVLEDGVTAANAYLYGGILKLQSRVPSDGDKYTVEIVDKNGVLPDVPAGTVLRVLAREELAMDESRVELMPPTVKANAKKAKVPKGVFMRITLISALAGGKIIVAMDYDIANNQE